jgi:N-acetyl sugar amidotransferase
MTTTATEPLSTATSVAYRVCSRCIMDTTDPEITFDADGACSHCARFAEVRQHLVGPPEERSERLELLVADMRAAGRGHDYDCVIGLSGGVDSTYVAYLVKQLGLRPLAVHLDNGWDSELAVKNVEQIVTRLGIDLHTHVLDWGQFKDLQLSFLKASVPDGEIPTDHAIGAVLLRTAARRGIPYLVSGSNVATEGILPTTWTYGVWDWKYISGVHRRFGTRKLSGFPHYTLYDYAYYVGVRRIRSVRLLDLVDYDKAEAMRTIESELGWRYYGGKHYESIYTKFFQGYILPRKFNIDKRRAHLSTLVCAGTMDRATALEAIQGDPYPPGQLEADREYAPKKLNLSEGEFERIMNLPRRSYRDYPNSEALRNRLLRAGRLGKRLRLIPQRTSL